MKRMNLFQRLTAYGMLGLAGCVGPNHIENSREASAASLATDLTTQQILRKYPERAADVLPIAGPLVAFLDLISRNEAAMSQQGEEHVWIPSRSALQPYEPEVPSHLVAESPYFFTAENYSDSNHNGFIEDEEFQGRGKQIFPAGKTFLLVGVFPWNFYGTFTVRITDGEDHLIQDLKDGRTHTLTENGLPKMSYQVIPLKLFSEGQDTLKKYGIQWFFNEQLISKEYIAIEKNK